MKPGLYGRLVTVSAGRRRWRVVEPMAWVDAKGVVSVVPVGFSCDKRSGRILAPAIGAPDWVWVFHDLESRIYRLAGWSLRHVDRVRFSEQIRHVSFRGRWRRLHIAAVRFADMIGRRSRGDGWHGSAEKPDEYDTPVWDEVSEEWVTLAAWAQRHWCPCGGGVLSSGLWVRPGLGPAGGL